MNFVKALFAGRLRAALVAATLCASMLGASGCSLSTNGYIEEKGFRAGEWTLTRSGYLGVLYRTNGGRSYNFPATEWILQVYRHYRDRGYAESQSAVGTLQYLSQFCPGGYVGDKCRDATAVGEWKDFLYDSLVPVVWRPGECIAVTIRFTGENWTTRGRTDRHCIPN